MGRKKKNPFVTYTTDEILATEENTYIIQVGPDLFSTDTKLSFTKKQADHYFETILLALEDQIKNGTKRDKKEAKIILKNMRILPLRFH